MIPIGITGQSGFIGYHLFHTLKLFPGEFTVVPFDDAFFDNPPLLDRFTAGCGAIIHLAGVNRHPDPEEVYKANIDLARRLASSLDRTGSRAHVIFASSVQENRDNPYGNAKREARELLARRAAAAGAPFTGLLIPNVFGPFGQPFYNSVVATFSHQLNRGETPVIDIDASLKLIYVGELVHEILGVLRGTSGLVREAVPVTHTAEAPVSAILATLSRFRDTYLQQGVIPAMEGPFERNLFNTFRSFADPAARFPVIYTTHTDDRGAYTEVMRAEVAGQASFSTTRPGIVRGNHFHTRKIERFAVIRGEAVIRLRRIGSREVFEFRLSGNRPAFVDMPVWYTHHIVNTGREDLYTVFWVNEFYDPGDADTWFETV